MQIFQSMFWIKQHCVELGEKSRFHTLAFVSLNTILERAVQNTRAWLQKYDGVLLLRTEESFLRERTGRSNNTGTGNFVPLWAEKMTK